MFTRERLSRWTVSLRENAEKQGIGALYNPAEDTYCGLGWLCKIEGLEFRADTRYICGITLVEFPDSKDVSEISQSSVALKGDLAEDFGSDIGLFYKLGMPNLSYEEFDYDSLAAANDAGVPWPVLADHFDEHYPCSDEQESEV